jgi:outer membrane protein assembly factor BamB
VDLDPCVLETCGNNQVDPGEECDGPINTSCDGFKQGLSGSGTPVCQPNCKADISMCLYCGNGKVEENEACEPGALQGASCASLGAGSGALSCKQCQLDLTSCSGGLCGDLLGLDPQAAWPAEGGCMKRPNSSGFEGPMLAEGAPVASANLPKSNLGLPALATDNDLTLVVSSLEILVWDGQTAKVGFTAGGPTTAPPVLLPGGSLLRLDSAGASILGLTRSGVGTWFSKASQSHPGGAPTTGAVVRGSTAFVGRADGSVWKFSLESGGPQVLYTSPNGVRGTMALDAERKVLYVPEDCSKIGPNGVCSLLAIDVETGAKKWSSFMGFPTTTPCHAAVGADGSVYSACGASALYRDPEKPEEYSGGLNTSNGSIFQAPAIGKDGRVYLLVEKGNGSSLFTLSAKMAFLPPNTVDLGSRPLAAPLLDSKGNLYVCLEQAVESYTPSGELRWSHGLQEPTAATGCSLALSGPGRLDVVTSSRAYRFQ